MTLQDCPDEAPIDRRTARSQRTRQAIVDALLDLIQEDHLRPTAVQVAARARISARSIFQHFPDLERLFAAAADRYEQRVAALHVDVAGGGLEERIDAFVSARARRYEVVTPVRRAAALQEPFSTELSRRAAIVRQRERAEVERVFARELAGREPADVAELTAALEVATTWTTWDALRRGAGLDGEAAGSVMGRTVRMLLRE